MFLRTYMILGIKLNYFNVQIDDERNNKKVI